MSTAVDRQHGCLQMFSSHSYSYGARFCGTCATDYSWAVIALTVISDFNFVLSSSCQRQTRLVHFLSIQESNVPCTTSQVQANEPTETSLRPTPMGKRCFHKNLEIQRHPPEVFRTSLLRPQLLKRKVPKIWKRPKGAILAQHRLQKNSGGC